MSAAAAFITASSTAIGVQAARRGADVTADKTGADFAAVLEQAEATDQPAPPAARPIAKSETSAAEPLPDEASPTAEDAVAPDMPAQLSVPAIVAAPLILTLVPSVDAQPSATPAVDPRTLPAGLADRPANDDAAPADADAPVRQQTAVAGTQRPQEAVAPAGQIDALAEPAETHSPASPTPRQIEPLSAATPTLQAAPPAAVSETAPSRPLQPRPLQPAAQAAAPDAAHAPGAPEAVVGASADHPNPSAAVQVQTVAKVEMTALPVVSTPRPRDLIDRAPTTRSDSKAARQAAASDTAATAPSETGAVIDTSADRPTPSRLAVEARPAATGENPPAPTLPASRSDVIDRTQGARSDSKTASAELAQPEAAAPAAQPTPDKTKTPSIVRSVPDALAAPVKSALVAEPEPTVAVAAAPEALRLDPQLAEASTLNLSTTSRASVETVAQVAAQIIKKLEGRSTRFEISLTPDDLGRVDVSLDIDADGQLAARLAFDNPVAATELRGRVEELRRQLQDAGFTVPDDAFSFAQRDPSSGQGNAFGRGDAARNARAFGAARRLSAEADLAAAPARWIPLTLTPERVDMKV
ncbi:MAG: flagellar hook-length control protein FliK [Pseudomonadota bacterium]